jgi:hypothetical protein
MTRWQVALLLVVACTAAAAAGFWAGFREAWTLGSAADQLERASRSVTHLEELQAGKTRPVALGLEFDVDAGLLWAYEILEHPLRKLWAPLWGMDVDYERYARRLADYRRDHPSSTRVEMFGSSREARPDSQEALPDFNRSAREVAARRDAMVQRYATPRSPK